MPLDYDLTVQDMVSDQEATLNADVRARAIASAQAQYGQDMGDVEEQDIPIVHCMAIAQYAAYLLCQQLAARFSGERESALGGDVARTESRARAYAARAKEYRTAYYAGIGLVDPFKQTELGRDQVAAAAVGSWPRRPRGMLTRGVL